MLSGGPAWSLVDCIKLNLTDPLQTSQRPALTLDEQALLKQTARLSAENSKHMHEMSFLKDGEEMLFDRFASIGPMAQVSEHPSASSDGPDLLSRAPFLLSHTSAMVRITTRSVNRAAGSKVLHGTQESARISCAVRTWHTSCCPFWKTASIA